MTGSTDPSLLTQSPGPAMTVAQIAELAGVSVPTVSRVINGRSDVAPLTRAKVEEVISQHGFRRLKRPANRAALLELVFHELAGAYAMEIIKGVERVADQNGLAVVLSEMHGHTPGRGWIEGVLARRPIGVIAVFSGLTPQQSDQIRSRDIPFVLLDPTGDPGHEFPSVGAANWSGGFSATRHLLDLGHRRIATITGPHGMLSSRARLDGYRAAMDATGTPVSPELIYEGSFQTEDGLNHGRTLLGLEDRPTAVVTHNDLQALGLYRAAAEAGLRIPDDLSVVGFDDLPLSNWITPPLTTIRQPLTEMAAAAANLAVTLGRGEIPTHHRIELATDLIVRSSTAPLHAEV
jgi:DNA-binding LacI/PurR family transcriptional regulator